MFQAMIIEKVLSFIMSGYVDFSLGLELLWLFGLETLAVSLNLATYLLYPSYYMYHTFKYSVDSIKRTIYLAFHRLFFLEIWYF